MKRRVQVTVMSVAVLVVALSASFGGAPATAATGPAPRLSPAIIQGWGYDEATTALLLEMYRGGLRQGEASVCWQLLSYVLVYRPTISWTEREYNGYAQVRPGGGYDLRLNPGLLAYRDDSEAHSRAASVLAHELRHAIWNSVLGSDEEEYVCDRTAGLAYQEMLVASGYSEEDASFRSRVVYGALAMDMADWVARSERARSGFEWSWPADLLHAGLAVLSALAGGGPVGHPIAVSDRVLGRP